MAERTQKKTIKIVAREEHPRGLLIRLSAAKHTVLVVLTVHASERMREWQISEERVMRALLYPAEVLKGHRRRFIAHRVYGRRVLRVIYQYDGTTPTVITLYNPTAKRYFQGGGTYEDQILARC